MLCSRYSILKYLIYILEHLEIGTNKENMQDKKRDGTNNAGEASSCAKITEEQVRRIRSYDGNLSELAREMDINYDTLRHVKTRRSWKHIFP